MTLFRGTFIDTPQSPFRGHHLRAEADAALLVRDGVITARGPADVLLREHPDDEVVDLRAGVVLPGFVDTHVLVMTHDHAEDVALVDAAVRLEHLGPIGLIGSSAKWARFRSRLLGDGHAEDVVDRVHTPIGLPGVTTSKEPAAIAVAVAAGLLAAFEREAARQR